MVNRTGALLATLALGVLTAGCGAPSDSSGDSADGPIIVGAAIALTGNVAAWDVPAWKAFKLKVDEINSAGGIGGRMIETVEADTKSDPARGKAAAERVLADGADIVLASCDFDFGSPAAITAENAGKLNFSVCAQSPKWGVQGIGPKSYTLGIADFAEGSVLANFASDRGFDRPYVLVDDSLTYTREVCDGFKQTWDGGLAGEGHFKNSDATIGSQITDILSAKPGFVAFCSLPPGGASALRQMRAAGIDVPIVSAASMDGTYWVKSVPKLSDFYVTSNVSIFGDDSNSKVNEVVKAYTDKYGAPPSGLCFAAYSAAEALEWALKKTDGATDGAELAKALDSMSGEELLIGSTTFTPELHINTDRAMAVLKFEDGKPKSMGSFPSDPSVRLTMSE